MSGTHCCIVPDLLQHLFLDGRPMKHSTGDACHPAAADANSPEQGTQSVCCSMQAQSSVCLSHTVCLLRHLNLGARAHRDQCGCIAFTRTTHRHQMDTSAYKSAKAKQHGTLPRFTILCADVQHTIMSSQYGHNSPQNITFTGTCWDAQTHKHSCPNLAAASGRWPLAPHTYD